MLRFVPGGLLLVILAGCGGGEVLHDSSPPGYLPDAQSYIAAVDWSAARSAEVRLSEYEFAPSKLAFDHGVPYHLAIRNDGKATHTFTAKNFFQAIAVQKLASDKAVREMPFIEQLELPAGATEDLYFVPVKAGHYPLECAEFLHAGFGMTGEIEIR